MRLDMIGLVVTDMEKAISFYELIGLEVISGDVTDAYVELGSDTIRLSLNQKEMIATVFGFEPELRGDTMELAFCLESADEVDELVKRVSKAGYEVVRPPWQAPWGQYYGLVRDADNHIISLFVET